MSSRIGVFSIYEHGIKQRNERNEKSHLERKL
jgi:hypothetical protein